MTRAMESWGEETRARAPSAERNRGPILELLQDTLPANAEVLEVASGTGQHASYFAQHLPSTTWQPSDLDAGARRSIQAWAEWLRTEHQITNVAQPLPIDVREEDWGLGDRRFDALLNINMIHISPWAACLGLFRGAQRHVREGGLIVLYGPYRRKGTHTAPSNAVFDESLRARDPCWGVRDLDQVMEVAADASFGLERVVGMPANNLTVVFRRCL